jgi:small subunit ribosomal protein S13
MARIAGVELPRNKRMEIALTYVFGIGRKSALDICAAAEIEPSRKTDEVTDEEVARLAARDRHQLQGRRRSPARRIDEHQAARRSRVLSGHAASPQSPRARSAHAHERAHPQGTAQDRRRQEDGAAEGVR